MYHFQKYLFLAVTMIGLLMSCDSETVKAKAKNSINNTGRSLGRGTSQFFKGVKEGVDKTLGCQVEVSSALQNLGVGTGKFFIAHSKGATDNILTVYLVFDKDFNRRISTKVFDKKGREYGRASTIVQGKAGEANYVDFVYSPRAEIEGRSKFVLE